MAAPDRRHPPMSTYVTSVASSMTVALLLWIGNTATQTLNTLATMRVVVERHDLDIRELQAHVRRDASRRDLE